MTTTITYRASVTIDGEVREVSGSGSADAKFVTTGTQTVGNTYEALAANFSPGTAVIIYNKGAVDVSVRVQLPAGSFTTKEYNMFTVPPNCIFCIPKLFQTDALRLTAIGAIAARSDSGTCDIDYCVIV